jgi:hypothetical protein
MFDYDRHIQALFMAMSIKPVGQLAPQERSVWALGEVGGVTAEYL